MQTKSQLGRRLDDLFDVEQTERDKAIKLISKILNKILSNPTEQKFGDLNYAKIRSKFEKCRPGFYLLYEAGFKQSMDGTRLKWTYDTDNYILLKSVNDGLLQKVKEPHKKMDTTTKKDDEWIGTAYRKKVMAKQKAEESETAKKKRLIKEKIAMQKKEQKIEQKRVIEKIKQQKAQQTEFVKEQFVKGMNDMMQEMLKNMMGQQEQQQNDDKQGILFINDLHIFKFILCLIS